MKNQIPVVPPWTDNVRNQAAETCLTQTTFSLSA